MNHNINTKYCAKSLFDYLSELISYHANTSKININFINNKDNELEMKIITNIYAPIEIIPLTRSILLSPVGYDKDNIGKFYHELEDYLKSDIKVSSIILGEDFDLDSKKELRRELGTKLEIPAYKLLHKGDKSIKDDVPFYKDDFDYLFKDSRDLSSEFKDIINDYISTLKDNNIHPKYIDISLNTGIYLRKKDNKIDYLDNVISVKRCIDSYVEEDGILKHVNLRYEDNEYHDVYKDYFFECLHNNGIDLTNYSVDELAENIILNNGKVSTRLKKTYDGYKEYTFRE